MSAVDFVNQQLREHFTDVSRLTAEFVLLRDRLMRAELKIQVLEETIAKFNADSVLASDSCVIKSADTTIAKH
ncbi:hypothetical protein LBMAG52_35230 [Planctomycetia bacterium]|nr:hypothetical protein LBMAG52_35230 [Planctomycetia bacterium]